MKRLDRSPRVNVGSWLAAQAGRRPDATAVIQAGTDTRTSYAQLNALSNRIAAQLLATGISPGDRVVLAMPSQAGYAAFYFAAAKVGAILVPLNTRLSAGEWAQQLRDAEPALVVAAPELGLEAESARTWTLDAFSAALPQTASEPTLAPGGEAPHVLMYTSGTTGSGKGVLLPHRKTLYNTLNAELYFDLCARDVVVVPVPLFHSFGLKILAVPALFAGATVVLVDRFDALRLQETVRRFRATILAGVPVMFRRMLEAGLDRRALESLRFAFSAGAPLEEATVRGFFEHGVALRQGYGQTETSILCTVPTADVLRKAGSVGRPVHYGEVRIADPSGVEVEAGVQGEVQVRGPICMLGYWRRPEETAALWLKAEDALGAEDGEDVQHTQHGWLRTGDLAVRDQDGFVRLVGRLKEMYISGGENVYPAEVERVLEQHPEIAEAAVVGIDDPEWGEVGRAYVVARSAPLAPAALEAFVDERLARYKRPREWVFVDALPRTASGKVQKHRLLGLPGA